MLVNGVAAAYRQAVMGRALDTEGQLLSVLAHYSHLLQLGGMVAYALDITYIKVHTRGRFLGVTARHAVPIPLPNVQVSGLACGGEGEDCHDASCPFERDQVA